LDQSVLIQSLADAVADFRDADDFPHARGAEEGDYGAAGLAWGPKNAPFEAVEELQQVFGMTAEIYARVAPYLTVYSVAREINPAMASERVVGILRQTDFGSENFSRSPGMAYSIRAEARGYSGAMFVREAVVQLDPQETVPVQILAWRQGVPTNPGGAL
jgi:general secretion pathway protein K